MPQVPPEHTAPGPNEAVQSAALLQPRVQKLLVHCSPARHGAEAAVFEGDAEDSFWSGIREFPGGSSEGGRAVLKAGIVISEVPSVFKVIEMLADGGVAALASARAGNGIVMIELRGDDHALLSAVDSLRMVAESGGGTLVINDASSDVKSAAGVWGDIGSGYDLMKRIKSGYDPLNILNPGRLV